MTDNNNTAAAAAITADRARTLRHNIAWVANGKMPVQLHGQTYWINYRDLYDKSGDPR